MKLTTEIVVAQFKEVHGDTYDYSKVVYAKAQSKVTIICPTHGEFEQSPNHHKKGRGCPDCSGLKKLTTETAVAQFKEVHGDKYDYSKVVYVNTSTKVTIICPTHGEFEQTPANHKKVKGCPSCQRAGFQPNLPAILYYLEVDGGTAYKIGITNRTVEQRFTSSDLPKIKVLNVVEYAHGGDAQKAEQKILKEFAYAKYTGDDLLSSGNTELFNQDILLKG